MTKIVAFQGFSLTFNLISVYSMQHSIEFKKRKPVRDVPLSIVGLKLFCSPPLPHIEDSFKMVKAAEYVQKFLSHTIKNPPGLLPSIF